jgi:hypothetical protein
MAAVTQRAAARLATEVAAQQRTITAPAPSPVAPISTVARRAPPGRRSLPVKRALWVAAALALASRAGAAAISEPCAGRNGPQAPDDPRLREWLRALVHQVAREEGVDPFALEALGMTETSLRPSLGRSCEVGAFQVMPWWAGVFRLDPPELLWDPRINAIAAARIYKDAWRRWDERYAHAGHNRALRAAGWRGKLDRATFAALTYNWSARRLRERPTCGSPSRLGRPTPCVSVWRCAGGGGRARIVTLETDRAIERCDRRREPPSCVANRPSAAGPRGRSLRRRSGSSRYRGSIGCGRSGRHSRGAAAQVAPKSARALARARAAPWPRTTSRPTGLAWTIQDGRAAAAASAPRWRQLRGRTRGTQAPRSPSTSRRHPPFRSIPLRPGVDH